MSSFVDKQDDSKQYYKEDDNKQDVDGLIGQSERILTIIKV